MRVDKGYQVLFRPVTRVDGDITRVAADKGDRGEALDLQCEEISKLGNRLQPAYNLKFTMDRQSRHTDFGQLTV